MMSDKPVSPLPEIASDFVALPWEPGVTPEIQAQAEKSALIDTGTKADWMATALALSMKLEEVMNATPSPVPLGEPAQDAFEKWYDPIYWKWAIEEGGFYRIDLAIAAWNAALASKAVPDPKWVHIATVEAREKKLLEQIAKLEKGWQTGWDLINETLAILNIKGGDLATLCSVAEDLHEKLKAVPLGEGETQKPPKLEEDQTAWEDIWRSRAQWIDYARNLEARLRSQEGPEEAWKRACEATLFQAREAASAHNYLDTIRGAIAILSASPYTPPAQKENER